MSISAHANGLSANPEQRDIGSAFHIEQVVSEGFSVKFFRAGNGPSIVVLHGDSGPRMSLALDSLATEFDVVVIEMPGWGDQVNDRSQTLDDLAQWIAAIIEQIGIPSFHLLGTSIGGVLALHLATLHPERVTSLVLESPSKFREGAKSIRPAIPDEELQGMFRFNAERHPRWERANSVILDKVRELTNRLGADADLDPSFASRLQVLSVPTLVLFGEYDGVIPPANGSKYRRLLPTCSFQIVSESAHDIQADRPEAFVDIVSEFLQRGMAFLLPERSTMVNP